MRISSGVLYVLFLLLGVLEILAFVAFGLPSLEGHLGVELYADTLTYEAIANGSLNADDMVSVSSNLWGPVFITRMLGGNRVAIFALNLAVAAVSIYLLTYRASANRLRLFILLSTSALFVFSFFGVNKEIILFAVSVLLYRYAVSGGRAWMIWAIILSLFVRWHMVMFCLLFWVAISSPWVRRRPISALIGLLLSTSVAYGLLYSTLFAHVDDVARLGAEQTTATEASGLYTMMLEVQRNFGYFLVVIPKSAQLLMGMASKIDVHLMFHDFWNYFVISVQSLQNVILISVSLFVWRSFHPHVMFLIAMYVIIFATTPVFGPRYFYPVSLWLIFALCYIHYRKPLSIRQRENWSPAT